MSLLAEIFSGERDWSDIFFLIAIIAAVLSGIGQFGANQLTKHAGWLLALAVALIAFALMLL